MKEMHQQNRPDFNSMATSKVEWPYRHYGTLVIIGSDNDLFAESTKPLPVNLPPVTSWGIHSSEGIFTTADRDLASDFPGDNELIY